MSNKKEYKIFRRILGFTRDIIFRVVIRALMLMTIVFANEAWFKTKNFIKGKSTKSG